MMQQSYPLTYAEKVIDSAAGVEFPDPYRWLELEGEDTQQWQAAQAQLADDYVNEWPQFELLKHSVDYFTVSEISLPQLAGKRWFRAAFDKQSGGSGILISDTPYGDGKLIFEMPNKGLENHSVLVWFSPSPDGKVLAVGICNDGSEKNAIVLISVDSGRYLANPPALSLMDGLTGGVSWLPDSSGFYFLGLIGNAYNFRQKIHFYDLAKRSVAPIDIPLADPDSREYLVVTVSSDNRYRIAHQGLTVLRPVAIQDMKGSDSRWVPFITDVDGSVVGQMFNDQFIAVTDVGSPCGRIVMIPVDNPYSANDVSTWAELVPESETVIRSITIVGKYIYISELMDTYSRVRIVDLKGNSLGEVPLPGKGAVNESPFPMMGLIQPRYSEKYLFVFSSFTESWGVYSHCPGESALETVCEPQVRIDNALVEDHWAISSDGTKIPYQSVRLADTDSYIPQPTLIRAYGGFNVSLQPGFQGAVSAFVAAGGIYVLGHLRGGGEFGKEWWKGGSMRNAQNSYQDLYAIAEDLINKQRTTSQLLALCGRSKGGLMAGVALTQRPNLWNAVVPQVPVLDLIGTLRHPYGRYCCEIEYGNPQDTTDIRKIAEYSPYHNINIGTAYPAVFLDAGANDPRCPPWHARKFAARLQAANSAMTPIFLRVWENSGHGLATTRENTISQTSTWLAFVMRQLEMRPKATSAENEEYNYG